MSRPASLILLGAAIVVAAGAVIAMAARDRRHDGPPDRPNVVVVMTDDQGVNSFKPQLMPRTFGLFADGTVFTRGTAVPPLCCPARAGVLTGQYPHNHGVFQNTPGYGGLVDPDNVLPVWLQRAGYRTALVGKWLHGYSQVHGPAPAPGWDRWFQIPDSNYTDYEVSDGGELREFGHDPADYATAVLTDQAQRFVEDGPTDRPFFLWLAYNAPHDRRSDLEGPCSDGYYPQPASSDAYERWKDTPLPRSAGYDERDVSDKPEAVRELDRFDGRVRREIRKRWRCTLATMEEVDAGVGELADQLAERGQLDDTIFVFLSDNGALFGEHRIVRGKAKAYKPAIRIPFAMRVPSETGDAPARIDEPVANIDLAPTILDYAGAAPCPGDESCRRMDGRSLRPLISRHGAGWPRNRGLLVELRSKCFPTDTIETRRFILTRPAPGEEANCPRSSELYDLRRDPDELRNLHDSSRPAERQARNRLGRRLEGLRGCSGIEGRDRPTDAPFCE